MKTFVCVLTTVLYLGIVDADRPSAKYLPPNFVAAGAEGSNPYLSYHAVSKTGSRLNSGTGRQYAAALSFFRHNTAATTQIPILKNDYNNDGSGNYNFGFETGNGIKRVETGHFPDSWPRGSLKISGSYSYTGDDGKLYSVNYKADSNGFHAEGAHLPTPPPIPREIQETLYLHQHGGGQPASTASYSSPISYSSSRQHASARNFASASQLSTANAAAPNINYLPPLQDQRINFIRHH